jgi:hypothetical protein
MTALTDLAERLKAAGTISAEDTLALRRQIWPDGAIAPDEAELVFALNDSVANASREWTDFFVEALCEYVVCQQAPRGYVDEAKAEWLIARISRDGKVESLGELELLVKILEAATNVPDLLRAFALVQIERVVVTGEGPTRDGGTLGAGAISASEVKLLRRIIYAQAGDGALEVSAPEAEFLFRIKDATLGTDNAPEWKTLFVQAVGNHLMAYNSYRPLARETAARLDAFMNDSRVNIGRFLGRVASATVSGEGVNAYRADQAAEQRPDHDAKVAAAHAVTEGESSWLKGRLDADGALDPMEQALLDFIAEEQRAA